MKQKSLKNLGAKALNDRGIPIVTKRPISIDDYFSTGRDKNTGEYQYISSYSDFISLREILNKDKNKVFTEEEIGKATIHISTAEKDKGKAKVEEDEKTLNEIQERE